MHGCLGAMLAVSQFSFFCIILLSPSFQVFYCGESLKCGLFVFQKKTSPLLLILWGLIQKCHFPRRAPLINPSLSP